MLCEGQRIRAKSPNAPSLAWRYSRHFVDARRTLGRRERLAVRSDTGLVHSGPNGLRDERRTAAMTIQRMDNVGIVVEDLDDAIAFFTELGMELEGKAQIEGLWADRTV